MRKSKSTLLLPILLLFFSLILTGCGESDIEKRSIEAVKVMDNYMYNEIYWGEYE